MLYSVITSLEKYSMPVETEKKYQVYSLSSMISWNIDFKELVISSDTLYKLGRIVKVDLYLIGPVRIRIRDKSPWGRVNQTKECRSYALQNYVCPFFFPCQELWCIDISLKLVYFDCILA